CLSWEDLYRSLPPSQQSELLALAARQGLIYQHQLPPGESTAPAARRPLLPQLLHGQTCDLAPLVVEPLTFHDTALDDVQREAVPRGVQTPDISLIQGLPGTGKSRVVAEIIRQCAARNQRVLFLAGSSAALDRVLEKLSQDSLVCAWRCLSADEKGEQLPTCVRRLTLPERVRAVREEALPGARGEAEDIERRLEESRRRADDWGKLEELIRQHQQTQQRRETLTRQQTGIEQAIQSEQAACSTTLTAPSPLQERLLAI